MIPEVENESVLQQTIGFELTHQVTDLSIDLLDTIEVTRLGKTKGRGVGLVRGEMNVSGVGPVGLLGKGRFIKMQGTFVSGSEGLHVKKGVCGVGRLRQLAWREETSHTPSPRPHCNLFSGCWWCNTRPLEATLATCVRLREVGPAGACDGIETPSRRENPGHRVVRATEQTGALENA